MNPFDPGYMNEYELAGVGFKAIGRNVQISKSCTIIGLPNIELGDNVRIDGYCSIIAAGSGFVRIGSFVHVAGYCGIYAGHGFTMDDFSGLSAGVRVYTGTDDYSGRSLTNPTVSPKYTNVRTGQVILRRHVIVGTGTVILPGVVAAEGAAVGALSLVTGALDAWTIYAGSPLKALKERSREILSLERQFLAEMP